MDNEKQIVDTCWPIDLIALSDEEALTPITNALYATGKYSIDESQNIAEGILLWIKDSGFEIAKAI